MTGSAADRKRAATSSAAANDDAAQNDKKLRDNNSTDDDATFELQSTSGTGAGLRNSQHGNIFQLKLLMLFLFRGIHLKLTCHSQYLKKKSLEGP